MIKTDLKRVSALELVEHLQSIESNDLELTFGFDLYFVPAKQKSSHISNIDVVVRWAEEHKYTTTVSYDKVLDSIVLRLRTLYPYEQYNEEEVIL